LILKGGKFYADAAALTVSTLSVFVWAALPQSFIPLLTRAFYSLRETWLPVKIAFVSVTVDVLLSIFLIRVLHLPVNDLAFADLANGTLNVLLLVFFLARRTEASVHHLIDWKSWGRTAVATTGMVGVILLMPNWILQLVLGAVSYFVFQLLLGAELRDRLKQKIFA
jgi:putative peptidoglycan lipid II flippase